MGCLILIVLVIWIGCLANAPGLTIFLTILVGGLFFYICSKIDEKKAQEYIEKEKIRKKQVLKQARLNGERSFSYDSSRAIEIMAIKSGGSNLEEFARQIQQCDNSAGEYLERAQLLVNYEIGDLRTFKNEICDSEVRKYESIIKPFKESLSLSSNKIEHPENLVYVSKTSLPPDPAMVKKELNENITLSGKPLANLITDTIKKGNAGNLKQNDILSLAIATTIAVVSHTSERKKIHNELLKASYSVGENCRSIESAMSSYQKIYSFVLLKRQQIKSTIEYMRKYYPIIEKIVYDNKPFNQLSQKELHAIEALYFSGEQLKYLLETEILNKAC